MADLNYSLKITRAEANDVYEALTLLLASLADTIRGAVGQDDSPELAAARTQYGRVEILIRKL